MVEHTPGPWTIRKSGDGKTLHISSEGGDWEDLDCDVDSDDKDFDIAMANARLIAAAPDLLDALKRLLAWETTSDYDKTCGRAEHMDAVFGAARAAIAKATES